MSDSGLFRTGERISKRETFVERVDHVRPGRLHVNIHPTMVVELEKLVIVAESIHEISVSEIQIGRLHFATVEEAKRIEPEEWEQIAFHESRSKTQIEITLQAPCLVVYPYAPLQVDMEIDERSELGWLEVRLLGRTIPCPSPS